jgi:hypothetical protein
MNNVFGDLPAGLPVLEISVNSTVINMSIKPQSLQTTIINVDLTCCYVGMTIV